MMENIENIESDLWEAADQLRANSKLTSTQYCIPLLGIIFLRHAANRFDNVSRQIEEDQKAGILPADADSFIAECRSLDLPVRGLMCIPPVDEEPALHFALLAKIAARNGLDGLSMGMSHDFEQAIALGATHVRVGSAIFGERVKSQE